MYISKKENILILISGILFLVLFGICSYFNRFAVDDYFHIHNESIYGIWGGMIEGYNNWGGRWTSYLLWNCIYHFHDSHIILFAYSFSIILFFILAIYLILQRISEIFKLYEKKNHILGYAFILTSFTFFFSSGKGEIWFWVASTAMYMESIIAFIIGLSLLLSKRKTVLHFLIIIICFAYAGGASETYAAIYILFLILILASFYIFPKKSMIAEIKSRVSYKIYAALVFLIAAFIVSITAAGNSIRASWLPEPSFINTFYITFRELGKLYIFKFSQQLPWALLFSIPIMYIGHIYSGSVEIKPLKKILKPLLFSLLLLIFIHYILLFPSCYILSEAGPDRSLILMILITVFFIAAWAFYFGKHFIKNFHLIRIGFFVSIIVIIISIVTICILQFNTLSKYSSSLDKRTEMLQQLQKEKNKRTITVSKLTRSGFLYSAEISTDTNYFGNEHYRLGLFVDYKVKSE